MTDKLLGALSLAKKAGALQVGFDAVHSAVKNGSAHLVLIAADVSPKTRQRILSACKTCDVAALVLKQNMHYLAQITVKPVGLLALTDKNFAALCAKAISQIDSII